MCLIGCRDIFCVQAKIVWQLSAISDIQTLAHDPLSQKIPLLEEELVLWYNINTDTSARNRI